MPLNGIRLTWKPDQEIGKEPCRQKWNICLGQSFFRKQDPGNSQSWMTPNIPTFLPQSIMLLNGWEYSPSSFSKKDRLMSKFGSYSNEAQPFCIPSYLQHNANVLRLRKERYPFWPPLLSVSNVSLYILSTSAYTVDWVTDQDPGLCWGTGKQWVAFSGSWEKSKSLQL